MCEMVKEGYVDMKIQAVLIDGFKNLSNVRISFDNITALVALIILENQMYFQVLILDWIY